MQLSKEEYARKRIHNGCLMQIESPVTQDNYSASLAMLNSYRRDRIFNPQLTAIYQNIPNGLRVKFHCFQNLNLGKTSTSPKCHLTI